MWLSVNLPMAYLSDLSNSTTKEVETKKCGKVLVIYICIYIDIWKTISQYKNLKDEMLIDSNLAAGCLVSPWHASPSSAPGDRWGKSDKKKLVMMNRQPVPSFWTLPMPRGEEMHFNSGENWFKMQKILLNVCSTSVMGPLTAPMVMMRIQGFAQQVHTRPHSVSFLGSASPHHVFYDDDGDHHNRHHHWPWW